MSRRGFILQALIVDACTSALRLADNLVAAQGRFADQAWTALRQHVIRMTRESLASNDLTPEEREMTLDLLARLQGNDMIARVLDAIGSMAGAKPADKGVDRFVAKNSREQLQADERYTKLKPGWQAWVREGDPHDECDNDHVSPDGAHVGCSRCCTCTDCQLIRLDSVDPRHYPDAFKEGEDKEADRFAAKNSRVDFPPPEDDQGPRCPSCGIPLEQATCDCTDEEKEAAARRELDRVWVLLTFVDGDTMWLATEADSPLAEHPSWSVHADL